MKKSFKTLALTTTVGLALMCNLNFAQAQENINNDKTNSSQKKKMKDDQKKMNDDQTKMNDDEMKMKDGGMEMKDGGMEMKDDDMEMKDHDMEMKEDNVKMKMDVTGMKNWPMSSQMAVKEQTDLYGKPGEITPTMAVWYNNGPWKKTMISKMESKHDFPKTHMDCMEQCINYKVPLDKYDDLARFDGSVTVDRTQGTLAARCDKEENNFLALNLAHDVITGKKTVEEARKAYGDTIKQAMSGNKPEYMKKLMFTSNMNAPDPDVNTIGM